MKKDEEFESWKKIYQGIDRALSNSISPKRRNPKGRRYIKVSGYYKGRGDFIVCDKCGEGHWEHEGTYVRPYLKRNPNLRKCRKV